MDRDTIVERVMSLLKVAVGQITTGKSEMLTAATSIMKILASIPLIKQTIELFRKKPDTFEEALRNLISEELKKSQEIESKILEILETVPETSSSKNINVKIIDSSNVAFAADSSTSSVNINKDLDS